MVKIETRLTPAALRKMRATANRRLYLSLSIVAVVFVALGILTLVLDLDNGDKTIGVTLVVAGVIVPLLTVLLILRKQRKAEGTATFAKEYTTQIFTFDDEGFTTETVTVNANSETLNKGSSTSSYDVIYRVKEKKEYYALYLSATQYYVLFKSDFTLGTPEELNALLAAKHVTKR